MRTFKALIGICVNDLSFMVMSFRSERDQGRAYVCIDQLARTGKLPRETEVIVSMEDGGLVLAVPPSVDAAAVFSEVRLELALQLSLQAQQVPMLPEHLDAAKDLLATAKKRGQGNPHLN